MEVANNKSDKSLQGLTRSKLPRLSVGERDKRWASVRSEMKREGIDCLLVHGDSGKWDQKFASMRYLSQIGGNGEDGWLVFPLHGDPRAFVFAGGAMLKMWSELQDWISDIRTAPALRWSESLIAAIKEMGLSKGRIGIVGLGGYSECEGTVSYTTLARLKEQFPKVVFSNATLLLENLQLYKSEEEIQFIERAVAVGDQGITVMREMAKPGVPEIKVFSKTLEALIEAGSEQPITFFWDAGPEVNHGQRFPGRTILEKGDVIVTEISPRFCGFWAHFSAPVAVGSPTPIYKELFEVAYSAYMNALDVLRPGIRIRDLAGAFEAPIKKAGMTSLHVYAHGTGGRGTEFPIIFPPSRRERMSPESLADFERVMNIEINKGMVLAFEPHVTKDNIHGLHLGDPVLVTHNGCRRLSNLDLRGWSAE